MNFLCSRTATGWQRVRNYSTYRDAVLAGQDLALGCFMIDTGERAPSREEQLMLEPQTKRNARKQQLLNLL